MTGELLILDHDRDLMDLVTRQMANKIVISAVLWWVECGGSLISRWSGHRW